MTLRNHFISTFPPKIFFEDVNILENAVKICAKEVFNLEVTQIVWATKSTAGKIDFKITSGVYRNYTTGTLGFTYPVMKTFTIHNDSISYSASQLNGALGQYVPHNKGTGLHKYYNSVIKKEQYSNITYIANDLGGNSFPATPNGVTAYWDIWRGLQIHETANALAELTGIYYANRSESYWTNPLTNTTYAFSTNAKLFLAKQRVNNLDLGNIDDDSGQDFELRVMKKYRQLTGYKN